MLVYLDVYSSGLVHIYASLNTHWPSERKSSRLTYVLDVHAAAKFNKDEPGAFKAYRPGDVSQRFEELDNVYRAALKQWKTIYPDGVVLLDGDNSAMPNRVLAGLTVAQRDALNAIWQEGENIGWYKLRRNDAKVDAICTRWFDTFRSFGIPGVPNYR